MEINLDNYNLGSGISEFPPQLHVITSCDIISYKFNAEKIYFLRKVCKDHSSLTLISVFRLNIALTEEIIYKKKISVQTIMYN